MREVRGARGLLLIRVGDKTPTPSSLLFVVRLRAERLSWVETLGSQVANLSQFSLFYTYSTPKLANS